MNRRSALYVGTVAHRRYAPRPNAFRYPTYWALIDVDELPELDRRVRGFGYRRPALVGFRDSDHLGPADLPVRTKLAAWLASQGVGLPAGRLEVLTNLRVLGHVFNPVSWWFCRDLDGRVALVVAEVSNTFGESHRYLLDDLTVAPDGTLRAGAPKRFHVSPFLGTEGHDYRFTFRAPGEEVHVRVEVDTDRLATRDGRVLTASQWGTRRPFTSRDLAAVLLQHPLVTLHTVVRIHRQAWRLWRQRTPFHRKPIPRGDGGRLPERHPAPVRATPIRAGRAVEPHPNRPAEELVP